MIRNDFYNKVYSKYYPDTCKRTITDELPLTNYFINIQFVRPISACFDPKVIELPYGVILVLLLKIALKICNAVCTCMVMQIKLVVIAVDIASQNFA